MNQRLIINDLLTPIGAFIRLRQFQPVFLFESAGNARGSGRFSFIGLEPVSTFSYHAGQSRTAFITAVREILAKLPRAGVGNMRLPAGLVGFTGRGLGRESVCGNPLQGIPDALLVVPRYLIVFDHLDHSLSLHRTDGDVVEPGIAREVIAALRAGAGENAPAQLGTGPHATIKTEEAVERITDVVMRIRSGEILQAPVIVPFATETALDPFQVYRGMRFLYPSPYLYYLAIAGVQIMGSSPDSLVRVEGERVNLSPCSALRARPRETAEEAAAVEALTADKAAFAEHAVIVEQAQEDLARIARPGSLAIGREHVVEISSHELHLVTDLSCLRADGCDHLDVFRSVFPAAGSACIPRDCPRGDTEESGLFGGAVGYFSVTGAMDFTTTDRAIVMRDGSCMTHAAVRVTAATEPQVAAAELLARGAALLQSLDIAQECL